MAWFAVFFFFFCRFDTKHFIVTANIIYFSSHNCSGTKHIGLCPTDFIRDSCFQFKFMFFFCSARFKWPFPFFTLKRECVECNNSVMFCFPVALKHLLKMSLSVYLKGDYTVNLGQWFSTGGQSPKVDRWSIFQWVTGLSQK